MASKMAAKIGMFTYFRTFLFKLVILDLDKNIIMFCYVNQKFKKLFRYRFIIEKMMNKGHNGSFGAKCT